MMLTFLLRLIYVLGTVLALQIDNDCVVQDRFEKPWLWSEARLNAWIPMGATGTFLTITMEYGDFYVKKYNANIGAHGVNVTLREGNSIRNIISNSYAFKANGWTEFVYSTDTSNTYISIAGGVDEVLANFTTADPSDTATIYVSGSNLTLNCPTGFRVWDLKGTTEIVPLDGSQEYRLTIFSKKEVLPTLKLGKETFSLSINETGITSRGITSKALPPFLQHNLTIECTQGDYGLTSCSIKLDPNQTTDRIFYMNEKPQYLAVEGRSNDSFYLLLHHTHFDKECPTESRQEDASDGAGIGLGVGIVIGILGGIALMATYFIYRKFTNATAKNTVESSSEENDPLFIDVESGRQTPSILQQRNPLVQAIREGQVKQVQKLMNEVDPTKLPHVEAHLQPNLKIVGLFSEHQPERNKLVSDVLQELNKRLDEIFKAAEAGLYKTGVDVYLRRYQLPGSVRDTKGRSLLHYIASCKDIDGGPLWEKKDIQDFLKDYTVFPNAVDYEGQTCLHELAISSSTSLSEITWNNEKMTVEKAWVELAKLLVKAGCDPSLENYALENPPSLAKEKLKFDLYDIFLTKNIEGKHSKNSLKVRDLQKAMGNRDIETIKNLLPNRYPVLALQASTDPLTEAVKRGQLETTTLLLSAGAPLHAKSRISITPFEVADDVGTGAIFPALLRREYVNKLCFEASKIVTLDSTCNDLLNNIEKLEKEIEQKGMHHSWRFFSDTEQKCNDRARDYLCLAASLGQSLVCQMLSFEDVFLQPLPHKDKPVKKAIENKQWQTLIVLYRDLNMSLFSTTDEKMLPPVFLKDVMEYENGKLQGPCKSWKSKFLTEGLDGKVSDIFEYLQVVAKEGLVSIYHKLRNFRQVPAIDECVEEFMGYNMLHIAAMHGQLNMVEYLLFNNANVMTKGKKNETALHLAALGGHRECMNYLQEHMKTKNYDIDVKAFPNLTAGQIVEGYEALVSENSSVLLPENHGQEVFSNFPSINTKMILEKKGSEFGISDGESFLMYTKNIASQQHNLCDVEKEMDNLLQLISRNDPRFKGKRITFNPKGNLTFTQSKSSLEVYWEVNDPIFTGLEPKHEGNECCSISLSLPNGFGSSSFNDEFFKAVSKSLRDYRFLSENIWLSYPCVTRADNGIRVSIVYYDEGIIRLLRVLLVPVLKVTYPKENRSDAVSELLEPLFKDPIPVYIANKTHDSWTYIVVQLEREILAHVSETQRLVLTACTLLTKLLYSPWWFPNKQSRRHGRAWGYYAFGLVVLPQSFLRTLFFEEITSTSEEDWAPSKFLDRVISIFRRATREVNGNLELRDIPLFLDSRHSRRKASPIIFSVISYLESLNKNAGNAHHS